MSIVIRALRGVFDICLRYTRETHGEDREVRMQSGSKHPFGSTELMYLARKSGGRGLKSVEEEYILTKIKEAAKLYSNLDPVMQVDKRCEENADESGPQALIKDAKKYAQGLGLELHLSYPHPVAKNETTEKWMERQL